MRLLIITPLLPPEPGGPSYYAVSLKEALEKKWHTVTMIPFRDVRKYPTGIRHIMLFFKVLKGALGKDGIIILDTVSVALPSVLAGWITRKKTIVRAGGDFVWERYIERTGEKVLLSEFYKEERTLSLKERLLIFLQKRVVCALATHIVFNTAWQRDLWLQPYQLSTSKTKVIENASKKSTRTHRGGEGFLCVWRPTAFKNTETLTRAYEIAKETCPSVALTIFKNIPREELYEHMEQARALVIPSLTELSPNMAFEALSMGLPVLLTKDCGAYDIFDGHVTWIDPTNPKDIAEKMCALMEEGTYEKVRQQAVSFSYTHTYDDVAGEFVSLIEQK